jgi:uncharacterized protein YqgC (DUF456 family)
VGRKLNDREPAFYFNSVTWGMSQAMFIALGILYSILFVLFAIVCWVASFLGMPGLWLLWGVVVLNAWLVPESYLVHMPWWSVWVLLALLAVGELLEFITGALGVGKLGGSRRSAALALGGSLLGAVFGLFVSIPIPIPIVGALLSSLLFSGLGAMAGAWLGEHWVGRDTRASMRVGVAAFVGRILGTIGKSIMGAVMVSLVLILVFT